MEKSVFRLRDEIILCGKGSTVCDTAQLVRMNHMLLSKDGKYTTPLSAGT